MEKAPRANYNNSAGAHLNENGTTFSKGERINESNRQERVNQKGRIDSKWKDGTPFVFNQIKKKRDKRFWL